MEFALLSYKIKQDTSLIESLSKDIRDTQEVSGRAQLLEGSFQQY